MKSMQRTFGKFTKRTNNEADVQAVLEDFKAADGMLDRMIKDLKDWRNAWEDILKLQYDASEAFATLYKPIEPANDPEQKYQSTETPEKHMQKCLGLQKEYSDEKADLAQEIALITRKLVTPAEDAKKYTKMLHKTLKHRENMKLDYERYQSRAEHARKKDVRSAKEQAAFTAHENNLAQAQIDYQTADEQVKQTFPAVTAAVVSLLPHMMANQIMLQTTLVGQLYTVMDAYTRKFNMSNPAPSDAEIIATFEHEFTSLRKELEGGISTIANGKAVALSMALPPEKATGTYTGLGLRNKAMARKDSKQTPLPHRPGLASSTSQLAITGTSAEEEEPAPAKPPRPGAAPRWNADNKPRIPSSTQISTYKEPTVEDVPPPPYDSRPTTIMPSSYRSEKNGDTIGGATPPGRYQTPMNGTTPYSASAVNNAPREYGFPRQPSSSSVLSAASAAAAKKKKPPPPIPAKRINSQQQAQYVTAMFDFEGQSEGDLSFREGDRIRIVRRTEIVDDWWEGEVEGRSGVGSFPANYVKL